MKTMLAVSTVLLASLAVSEVAQAQRSDQPSQWIVRGEEGIHVIGNAPVSSMLTASGASIRISGRTSFHFAFSKKFLEEEAVQVNGLSLVYFDVPQQLIAGSTEVRKPSGFVGFAATTHKPQRLRYDPRSGQIQGVIRGYIDAAYMSALIKRPLPDEKGDLFETVTQPATLLVHLKLPAPLETGKEEVQYTKAALSLTLKAKPTRVENYKLPSFDIVLKREQAVTIPLELAPWYLFEVAKRLCVQPVRIGRIRVVQTFPSWPFWFLALDTTGAGLAFGQPGASTQWAKADVIFNYRDWKTVWKSGYWVVDTNGNLTSAEQSNLLDEVDDADCIEVYFIDEFDPQTWGGGGATWGSGTAGSKIITSDVVADCGGTQPSGVDFNHLAHELGHVMGLRHPGQPATANAVAGSSGTLMCPSGWCNDNPGVNSQENENLLSNPLLQFAIKLVTPGPDCQNSADCGSCP